MILPVITAFPHLLFLQIPKYRRPRSAFDLLHILATLTINIVRPYPYFITFKNIIIQEIILVTICKYVDRSCPYSVAFVKLVPPIVPSHSL